MKTLHKLLEITWIKWLWTVKVEVILLILSVAFFFKLTGWLRAVDATAAPLDAGILMAPAVGIIGTVAGLLLFWIVVRAAAPKIDQWFDGDTPHDPDSEPPASFDGDWAATTPATRLAVFTALLVTTIAAVALITLAVR